MNNAAMLLLVDDTPANLTLLSGLLVEHGHDIRPVLDGQAALRLARQLPIDLILLDINMPGMSGYEVCEQLKSDPRTAQIPIIFISALDSPDDKVRAFSVGGVDYVSKPFHASEVLARVETHLTLRRQARELQDLNAALLDRRIKWLMSAARSLQGPVDVIYTYLHMLETWHQSDLRQAEETQPQRLALLAAESTRRLKSHIEYVMKSGLDAETKSVHLGRWKVETLIEEAVAGYKHTLSHRNIDVIISIEDDVVLVQVDKAQFGFVLETLLGRALSVSPNKSRVQIKVRRRGKMVQFIFTDQGAGIEPRWHQAIFTPMFDESSILLEDRGDGLGIGLAVVKRVVEMHRGRVWVESIGRDKETMPGSTFYVEVPSGTA